MPLIIRHNTSCDLNPSWVVLPYVLGHDLAFEGFKRFGLDMQDSVEDYLAESGSSAAGCRVAGS